jgi:hypothetical protein
MSPWEQQLHCMCCQLLRLCVPLHILLVGQQCWARQAMQQLRQLHDQLHHSRLQLKLTSVIVRC